MKASQAVRDFRILVVDDEEMNVLLLERLLDRWGYTNVITTTDSSQVASLVDQTAPDLVLLDLWMPSPDGFEVLDILRAYRSRTFLPVLILTADVTRQAREQALELGATDFLSKPFDPAEVRLRIANLLQTRRLHLDLAESNEVLDERAHRRTLQAERSQAEIVERLALAAEYRDDNTHEHTERVGRIAALVASMMGLDMDQVDLIRRAAPLHDVGNIGVSDRILLKPGRLTPDEFEAMKEHTLIGSAILSGSDSDLLRVAEEIARTHHERWDGTGYPVGLAGEEIPLSGRIVALADVFDTLTHDRPYRAAWLLEAACAEIRSLAGSHLDPAVVEAFEALDPRPLLAPIGSLDLHDAAASGSAG